MLYTYQGEEMGSYLAVSNDLARDYEFLPKDKKLIHIYWNRNEQETCLYMDNIPFILKPQQITTSTFFHQINFPKDQAPITSFSFNREFYCIRDHDHEVSCNGIIFFGTQENIIVSLDNKEEAKFELLFQVFQDEFETRDDIQGEMLQMLLKRFIIKTTRLARKQHIPEELEDTQIDTLRKFNVLVDLHFRSKKQVADYAEMLNKSPKTLSNLFAKYNNKSPLQLIHERTVLEAKRLLLYTDKSAKEIAFELGFNEVASFHKLFKKITSQTPMQFKNDNLNAIREK